MNLIQKAEKHIKEKFTDHDHCSQSARAVAMFLQGVEWALGQEPEVKFGPDVDHDAHVVWREHESSPT